MRYPIKQRKEGVIKLGDFWIVRIKNGYGNRYTTISKHKTKDEAENAIKLHQGT
jgi:hypothetical protein